MKILVTGSSGYVGSSFIDLFREKHDLSKFSLLQNTIEDLDLSQTDVILHCAALVHQKIEHPYEKYLDINVDYPVTLAKKAKESGVKQFVFMSTIAVYGEKQRSLDEKSSCEPTTPYGRSKLKAERQLQALEDESFTVSIIRPPMIYGKDAPGNISSLIDLVKKIPVLPFGKIENKRSFIFIQNLCDLIDTVIDKHVSGVFLASDDDPISTTALVEKIAQGLGKNVYLIKPPFFEALLEKFRPSLHQRLFADLVLDNTTTKQRLEFKNRFDVDDGIRSMTKGY